jgi:hypothetical protein
MGKSSEPTPESRKLTGEHKRRRKIIRPYEAFLIVAFVVVVGVLLHILITKVTLSRDTSHARTVSDKVINDIQHRNGSAVRSLGTPTFQKTYSASGLTQEFQHITIATLKPPKLVDTTVVDSSTGRTVFFIYEYTALKVPYYVRTSILNKSGHWQLTSISGSADESELIV